MKPLTAEQAIESLEKNIAGYKDQVERQKMALRLANNRDFKKLILDEFCVQECARYAQASGDPMLNAEQRADSLGMAQAAGHLRRWLSVLNQMGNTALGQIEANELELERVRAGEGFEEEYEAGYEE